MTVAVPRWACLGLACVAAGCTVPPMLTVTLTRAELQQAVASNFPVSREALLTRVTLRDPRVILRDGDPRIGVDLEAEVRAPLGEPYRGRIAAVGNVVYDPTARAFFFRDPRVERLDFPGLGRRARRVAASAIEAAAAPLLDSTPVHRLPERDVRERATRYLLRDVTVREGAVLLTLGLPEGDLAALRRREWIAWSLGVVAAGGLLLLLRRRRTPRNGMPREVS